MKHRWRYKKLIGRASITITSDKKWILQCMIINVETILFHSNISSFIFHVTTDFLSKNIPVNNLNLYRRDVIKIEFVHFGFARCVHKLGRIWKAFGLVSR